jgi:hypothetical protein
MESIEGQLGLGMNQRDLISMTRFTKKYIKYLNFNEKIYFKDSKPLEANYAIFSHV